VVRKIGELHSRVLFVTGERFSAVRAREIGLVHSVTTAEELDATVEKTVRELLTGNAAVGRGKKLSTWAHRLGDTLQIPYSPAHCPCWSLKSIRLGANEIATDGSLVLLNPYKG
jgi:hypothetical protein